MKRVFFNIYFLMVVVAMSTTGKLGFAFENILLTNHMCPIVYSNAKLLHFFKNKKFHQ